MHTPWHQMLRVMPVDIESGGLTLRSSEAECFDACGSRQTTHILDFENALQFSGPWKHASAVKHKGEEGLSLFMWTGKSKDVLALWLCGG